MYLTGPLTSCVYLESLDGLVAGTPKSTPSGLRLSAPPRRLSSALFALLRLVAEGEQRVPPIEIKLSKPNPTGT